MPQECQPAETEEAYLGKDDMCNKWMQMTKKKESHKIDFNVVVSMVNIFRNKQGLEIQHIELGFVLPSEAVVNSISLKPEGTMTACYRANAGLGMDCTTKAD